MPAINEAIARMKADGRLEALRLRYTISVPPPPPDVLRVGIAHVPPLSIIDDDQFSGLGVEVTRTLAERANFEIEFVPLPVSDWVKGPVALGLDAVSVLVVTPEREQQFDFSFPVIKRSVAVVLDADDDASPSTYEGLAVNTLGVIGGSVFEGLLGQSGSYTVVGFETFDAMFAAQIAQEIDAIVTAPDVAKREIERLRATEQLRVHVLGNEAIDSGIALRPGLGALRERLNAVIPGYLLSEDYAALREEYLGEPVFWTPTRINSGLGVMGALFLGLSGFVIWQRRRQRQRDYARQQADLKREQAHAKNLEALVNDLERSNRELDEFAYTASHDLKEPLRGIGINASFLAREELSEKGRQRVDRMVALAKRMDTLVSDLLYFSRLGRGEKAALDLDPKHIVDGIRIELEEWMQLRNGEILCGDLPWVHAERSKVKTLFQNLIVNGLKYNQSDRKTVEIGFEPEVLVDGAILTNVYSVSDNGVGIDARNHDKIFRIFQRLHREDEFGPGTGAGLAFVRKIVEDMGGAVMLSSTPGDGSVFYFALPPAREPH